MSGQWHRVQDVKAFLAEKGVRSVGVHAPRSIKRIPWPMCRRCGLLYLKNAPTAKAISAPCVVYE